MLALIFLIGWFIYYSGIIKTEINLCSPATAKVELNYWRYAQMLVAVSLIPLSPKIVIVVPLVFIIVALHFAYNALYVRSEYVDPIIQDHISLIMAMDIFALLGVTIAWIEQC